MNSPTSTSDVPAKVFQEFIAKLESSNESVEMVARLRNKLLDDKIFTDESLRIAVLGEDPLP